MGLIEKNLCYNGSMILAGLLSHPFKRVHVVVVNHCFTSLFDTNGFK